MRTNISPTYNELCTSAFYTLLAAVKDVAQPLVCTTSGDTPKGVYGLLANAVANEGLNISDWKFVSLDEWVGMNRTDEGSCGWHLDQQLFSRIPVATEAVCLFDGRAANLHAECQRIEEFIAAANGIQVAFVGLGLNGHVGMNEPGTPPGLHSHIADIAEETQLTGQKYFTQPTTLSRGLTLGIANLLEAKNILLLVNGAHKANIVKQITGEAVSNKIPATHLRKHPACTLFVDEAAASLL